MVFEIQTEHPILARRPGQDLVREQKKLWNMKMMVNLVAGGTLGTFSKDLEKRLGKQEITPLLKSTRNL